MKIDNNIEKVVVGNVEIKRILSEGGGNMAKTL